MPISEILVAAISPALALLPDSMSSKEAEVMLLAIGGQESGFRARRQAGNGPARGFWQMERGGGVTGVLQHVSTAAYAAAVCHDRNVLATPSGVWASMEHDDILAAAFARLLLWTDPKPLPAVGEVGKAWELYLRTWRPGKPHRNRWDACYAQAMDAVGECKKV